MSDTDLFKWFHCTDTNVPNVPMTVNKLFSLWGWVDALSFHSFAVSAVQYRFGWLPSRSFQLLRLIATVRTSASDVCDADDDLFLSERVTVPSPKGVWIPTPTAYGNSGSIFDYFFLGDLSPVLNWRKIFPKKPLLSRRTTDSCKYALAFHSPVMSTTTMFDFARCSTTKPNP